MTEENKEVALAKVEAVVDLGGLEINPASPSVEKRLKELKATRNILHNAGIKVNNAFYDYALSEHKKVLIARATADYQ